MFKKILFLGSICLLASASIAHADTIFTLTNDACSGTCGTGPFGTIDLAQTTSKTVTVTETLASNERFAGTGAGDALEFNVTGPVTIDVLTANFSAGGADSASAFGSFLDSVVCTTCQGGKAGNPAGPLVFTVTSAGGVTIADFLANSGGYFFAADIVGNNGNTGNVGAKDGVTPPPAVPEPSSLLLFGTGLTAAAGVLRRRVMSAVKG